MGSPEQDLKRYLLEQEQIERVVELTEKDIAHWFKKDIHIRKLIELLEEHEEVEICGWDNIYNLLFKTEFDYRWNNDE